jgi:hypothetical protein
VGFALLWGNTSFGRRALVLWAVSRKVTGLPTSVAARASATIAGSGPNLGCELVDGSMEAGDLVILFLSGGLRSPQSLGPFKLWYLVLRVQTTASQVMT